MKLIPVITALLLGLSTNATAVIVTFDDLTQQGTGISLIGSPYYSSGFAVSDSSGQFLMWQSGSSNYFGATALAPGDSDSVTTLTQTSANPFSLSSIDFAPLFGNIGYSQTLVITGVRSNLIAVTQTCTIPEATMFDTCVFSSQFQSLTSVAWGAELFQYTNLVVNPGSAAPAPEPPSIIFVLGTLLGTVFVKVRRRTW